MTFLSPFEADGEGILWPALVLAHPVTSRVVEQREGRSLIEVTDPPAGLLADWRFPPHDGGEVTLASYRAAMVRAADLYYAAKAAEGVTVGGVTYAASIEDQNRMDAFTTLLNLSLTAGVASGTTEFTIYAADGSPVTLQASAMIGVLLQYGSALAVLSADYASLKKSALDAATLGDLDAISLPQ